MSAMVSQITSFTIVYSTVYLGTDERKHQSSASLAFVRGIHQWSVNYPHTGPVTQEFFPFDDVIMRCCCLNILKVPWWPSSGPVYNVNRKTMDGAPRKLRNCVIFILMTKSGSITIGIIVRMQHNDELFLTSTVNNTRDKFEPKIKTSI